MSTEKEKLKNLIDILDDKTVSEVLATLQLQTDKANAASTFLFSVCNGMSLKMMGKKDIEIWYYQDTEKGEWIFHQDYKTANLYVSYPRVWLKLEAILGNNYVAISNFIRDWVETNLHWQGLTPIQIIS